MFIYEWGMNRTDSSFLHPFIWRRTIESLSSYSIFLCSLFKAVLLLASFSYSGLACLLSGVTLLLGTMSEHIQLSIALCRIGFYTVSQAHVSIFCRTFYACTCWCIFYDFSYLDVCPNLFWWNYVLISYRLPEATGGILNKIHNLNAAIVLPCRSACMITIAGIIVCVWQLSWAGSKSKMIKLWWI